MSNIKDQLVKLGAAKPELRPHLRPILDAMGRTAKTSDSVYRDLLSISSGSLNSMLDLGGSYAAIDAAHQELMEFAKESPQTFHDWRDAVEAFKKTRGRRSSRTAAGWSAFKDMDGKPLEMASRVEFWVDGGRSWVAPIVGIDTRSTEILVGDSANPIKFDPVKARKHLRVASRTATIRDERDANDVLALVGRKVSDHIDALWATDSNSRTVTMVEKALDRWDLDKLVQMGVIDRRLKAEAEEALDFLERSY